METRCKPGQKAWVIKGKPRKNIGRLVRVTRLIEMPAFMTLVHGPIWKYEGNLVDIFGGRLDGAADNCLLPIDEDTLDLEKDWAKLWDKLPIDEKEKL